MSLVCAFSNDISPSLEYCEEEKNNPEGYKGCGVEVESNCKA